MAGKLEYPIAEHYEPPISIAGVVEDELQTYRDPQALFEGLQSLHHLYKGWPFTRDSLQMAKVVRMATKKVATELDYVDHDDNDWVEGNPFFEETRLANRDFYMGSLLAIHAMTKPSNQLFRRMVLGQNIFETSNEVGPEEQDLIDQDDPLFLSSMQNLDNFRKHGWVDLFDTILHPDLQSLLTEAASRLYTEDKRTDERSYDFLAGYSHADYNVRISSVKEVNPAKIAPWMPIEGAS